MPFIENLLPPGVVCRYISAGKGRGLFAERDFEENELVMADKSLMAMVHMVLYAYIKFINQINSKNQQHVKNRQVAHTCANCFRFLGSLETQLAYLCKYGFYYCECLHISYKKK